MLKKKSNMLKIDGWQNTSTSEFVELELGSNLVLTN